MIYPVRQHARILVLGGGGFIGSNLSHHLLARGFQVRAVDTQWPLPSSTAAAASSRYECVTGSATDPSVLQASLSNMDAVVDCLCFSVPSTSPTTLQVETGQTLPALERLLTTMSEVGCRQLFFFSSGGTIYGDTAGRAASETDPLKPTCSYALGKLLCEEVIRFYGEMHGLTYRILRVSNLYGRVARLKRNQGVIDTFVDHALNDRPITVWGEADRVRDYLFIDDFVQVVGRLLEMSSLESLALNVGSGIGTSVREIIHAIERVSSRTLQWEVDPQAYAGVPTSILDVSKLNGLLGTPPARSLMDGITELWLRRTRIHR